MMPEIDNFMFCRSLVQSIALARSELARANPLQWQKEDVSEVIITLDLWEQPRVVNPEIQLYLDVIMTDGRWHAWLCEIGCLPDGWSLNYSERAGQSERQEIVAESLAHANT